MKNTKAEILEHSWVSSQNQSQAWLELHGQIPGPAASTEG